MGAFKEFYLNEEYNNFISFKSIGTVGDLKIIRDLKHIGDIINMSGKYMVEISSLKIEDKMFPTLGAAKSFVYSVLTKKKS